MTKGFLYCAVALVLAMCPRDRAISTASPTSNVTGGSSARARPTERQEGSCAGYTRAANQTWRAISLASDMLPGALVGLWSQPMNENGPDAPEVVKFEPKGRPRTYDTQAEEAGRAIIAKIRRAAELANENCDRAMKLAHKLSMELRAAEDRINQLEADVQVFRDRAARAERWLQTLHKEIEEKLIAPRSASGAEQKSLSLRPGQVKLTRRSRAAGENTGANWAPCIDPSRRCALPLCRRPIHALPECHRGEKRN
jgi:hypothetical protein